MENNTLSPTPGTTNLSVRKGFWKDVFGQFVTGEFWKGVTKTIFHEMMVAFFTSLGGVLVWYGKKKANPEISQQMNNNYAQPSPAASAFNNQGFPRPVTPYSPSYGHHMPMSSPPSSSVEGFPGFGPNR